MTEPSMHDRAIALAARGFRVFKLIPNSKRPAVAAYAASATDSVARASAAWSDPVTGESTTHNIGVLMGDGLVTLDVDVRDGKQGDASLQDLVDLYDLNTNTLTAITSTGGRHLIYRHRADTVLVGGTNKLGPGLDVKAQGQYIVGAGSVVPQGEYRWLDPDAPILDLPAALVERCRPRRQDAHTGEAPLTDLDEPAAIARATDWLQRRAPEAVQGAGGNEATYRIACQLKDFGLSESHAVDLMLDHWNETKAQPPWPADELAGVVANAYRYGTSPPGIASAAADFSEVTLAPEEDWPTPTPLRKRDPATIPLRQWIVPDLFCRGFVTVLISPGGTGKTQLLAAACLAVASGSEKPLGKRVNERTAVWYWNQEDDADELDRRVGAARKFFQLPWQAFERDGEMQVYVDSGVDRPLTLARRVAKGDLAASRVIDRVIAAIRQRGIGLLIVDPLSEFHEAEENDNSEMRMVFGLLRRIAVQAGCAVAVAAHSRKLPQAASDSYVGDIDSLRGASSQGGALRLAYTLYTMSAKDAKEWNVAEEDRHKYVRMDNAKTNLTAPGVKPDWYRRVSVPLDEDGVETIGVLEPVSLERRTQVDPIYLLARALAEGEYETGEWVRANDVIDTMSEQEQASFGARTNRTRVISQGLGAYGTALQPRKIVSCLTDFGTVEFANKRGNGGCHVRLAAYSSIRQDESELSDEKLSD